MSFLFLMMRGYLRLKAFRRLFADDALVLLAWLILSIIAITVQARIHITYSFWDISDKVAQANRAENFKNFKKQVNQGLAMNVLNQLSLWCIKFAFLLLFKRMSKNVKGQRNLWWFVFVITVATLIVSIGTPPYSCGIGDIKKITG